MKKTIILSVTLLMMYWTFMPVLRNAGTAFFSDMVMCDAFAKTITVLLAFGLICLQKDERSSYGICLGRYKSMMKLILPMFILPLWNIPYLFIDVDLRWIHLVNCIFIACMEELLFRGGIYKLIYESGSEKNAVIYSSIAFGAIHLVNFGSMPLYFVLMQIFYAAAIGLTFAVVRAKTGSILFPIIVHSLLDLIGCATEVNSYLIDTAGAAVCILFGAVYLVYYLKSCRTADSENE